MQLHDDNGWQRRHSLQRQVLVTSAGSAGSAINPNLAQNTQRVGARNLAYQQVVVLGKQTCQQNNPQTVSAGGINKFNQQHYLQNADQSARYFI